jgi:hypothetical protein
VATKSASVCALSLIAKRPPRLQVLMLRLAAQDLARAASNAPSIDDMARDEVA